MRIHNQIKTIIFSLIVGLALGTVYLYFYINGYFGTPVFGWEFLGMFVLDFFHPLFLLSYGLVAIIAYTIWKRPPHIEHLNLKSYKLFSLFFICVMSLALLYLIYKDKELAKILGFFYLLLVGFDISYYFGSKLFELN